MNNKPSHPICPGRPGIDSGIPARTSGRLAALLLLALLTAWPLYAQQPTKMNEGETVRDAAVPQNKAMDKIEDVPGLPRVLIIGDSISIAYTVTVRELLNGKANVHRAPVNCQSSTTGLSGTTGPKSWQGDQKWDVIHFNFGIWDAKIVPATGQPAVSQADYVKNLTEIARRLQATGAKVIFATTTPIPDSLTSQPTGPGTLDPKARFFVPLSGRTAAAVEALQKMGVVIDDLNSVIHADREKYWNPKDLHFSPQGSQVLGRAVAASIEGQLPPKSP